MDNKINKIRKEISALRAQMLEMQALMQAEIGGDRDCTASATKLITQRMEMARLVRARKALGDQAPFGPESRKLHLARR